PRRIVLVSYASSITILGGRTATTASGAEGLQSRRRWCCHVSTCIGREAQGGSHDGGSRRGMSPKKKAETADRREEALSRFHVETCPGSNPRPAVPVPSGEGLGGEDSQALQNERFRSALLMANSVPALFGL